MPGQGGEHACLLIAVRGDITDRPASTKGSRQKTTFFFNVVTPSLKFKE